MHLKIYRYIFSHLSLILLSTLSNSVMHSASPFTSTAIADSQGTMCTGIQGSLSA